MKNTLIIKKKQIVRRVFCRQKFWSWLISPSILIFALSKHLQIRKTPPRQWIGLNSWWSDRLGERQESVRIGLTLSNSDTFQTEQFLTLSDSDTFRFWHFPILTLSDSDTFRFWHFPILTLSGSDTFRFWHFPIVRLGGAYMSLKMASFQRQKWAIYHLWDRNWSWKQALFKLV